MPRKYSNGYRKLIAWQEAKKLSSKIYKVTEQFPKEEQYGLVSQLRRAAVSIMANIAEGSAMPTKAHRDSFYGRARGSTVEVDCLVEFSFELQKIVQSDYDDLIDHTARVSYLLTRMIESA